MAFAFKPAGNAGGSPRFSRKHCRCLCLVRLMASSSIRIRRRRGLLLVHVHRPVVCWTEALAYTHTRPARVCVEITEGVAIASRVANTGDLGTQGKEEKIKRKERRAGGRKAKRAFDVASIGRGY